MTAIPPVLHVMCGKIASGKSTLAAKLAVQTGAVLIAEDHWLAALYPDQLATPADYARCSSQLQMAMGPHVSALLAAGVSVVLDFPANTLATRAWVRGILDVAPVDHKLHVFEVPDAVCLARLEARNAQGDHPFAATQDQFRRMTKHYVPPANDEGFDIVLHRPDPGTP